VLNFDITIIFIGDEEYLMGDNLFVNLNEYRDNKQVAELFNNDVLQSKDNGGGNENGVYLLKNRRSQFFFLLMRHNTIQNGALC